MKKITTLALSLAALLVAGNASAETSLGQTCNKSDFSYLIDYSGSMMLSPNKDRQTQKEKKAKGEATESSQASDSEKKGLMTPEEFDDTRRMTSVKMLMEEINNRLPSDEEIKAGIYSVAPYSEILPYGVYKAEDFKKDGIDEVYDRMETMGRRSPLGIGLEKHGETLASLGQGGAVILITDGVVNRGRAVASADEPERQADNSKDGDNNTSQPGLDAFYAAAPSACIHVISLADTEEGKAMVDKIVAKKGCSTKVDLKDLMTDNNKLDKFISDTLYSCQKVISLRGINFAFDKYNIDAKSEKILQEALPYIQDGDFKDKPFKIVGWTDYIGSDKYNATLSLNRAKSVRTWLINHGVDANRLSVQGAGKSFKYTNKTAEGRYMNRRMDFVFDD